MTIHVPIMAVFAVLNLLILAGIAVFAWKIQRKPRVLWLVGRYKGGRFPAISWDFQGIFTARAAAITACEDKTYFIGRVDLDKPLPKDTSELPEVEYPLTNEAD